MPLDDIADRSEQRGNVAALHPGAPARIEHRLQLLGDEGNVGAAPEHRRHHPGQPQRPGVMLHVLGVDEHLERTPLSVLLDIVDRDVDRVRAFRPFELVGRAVKLVGARLQHLLPLRPVGFANAQYRAGDRVRPIGRQAFAAEVIALDIDVGEILEADVLWAIHGLRDRAVDQRLRGGLHGQMVGGGQGLGADEQIRRRRCVAFDFPPHPNRIILDLLFTLAAVRLPDLAGVGISEHRLDPRADVARQQRRGPGRRNRGKATVAKPVLGDQGPRFLVERLEIRPLEHRFVVKRERALLGGELCRCPIGFPLDRPQPLPGQSYGLAASIGDAAE